MRGGDNVIRMAVLIGGVRKYVVGGLVVVLVAVLVVVLVVVLLVVFVIEFLVFVRSFGWQFWMRGDDIWMGVLSES